MMTRRRTDSEGDTVAELSVSPSIRNTAVQFGALAIVALMVWLDYLRDGDTIAAIRETKAAIESASREQIALLNDIRGLQELQLKLRISREDEDQDGPVAAMLPPFIGRVP